MLKQKYLSKDASIARQNTILRNHGVRWSCLDWIPGWRPSMQTALDFMHCIYLGTYCCLLPPYLRNVSFAGVVAYLFTRILFAAHLFPGAGGPQSSKQKFEDAINSIKWPSHVTRLPKNVGPG